MTRGTVAGMAAGTAGMIRGSIVRPVIGGTVRPGASAGAGVVFMPAIGGRLGLGLLLIGGLAIGAVATGGIITTTTIITMLRRTDITPPA